MKSASLSLALALPSKSSSEETIEPAQIYGSNQIELAWTVLTVLIVFVLILVTSRTIADVQNKPAAPDSLKVTVKPDF
ncbi:MAG TPA: hypothetical protein VNS63_20460 [Blastocatellia bacterium]|nr:hypothetical protein [Blastocatellia bacterium]